MDQEHNSQPEANLRFHERYKMRPSDTVPNIVLVPNAVDVSQLEDDEIQTKLLEIDLKDHEWDNPPFSVVLGRAPSVKSQVSPIRYLNVKSAMENDGEINKLVSSNHMSLSIQNRHHGIEVYGGDMNSTNGSMVYRPELAVENIVQDINAEGITILRYDPPEEITGDIIYKVKGQYYGKDYPNAAREPVRLETGDVLSMGSFAGRDGCSLVRILIDLENNKVMLQRISDIKDPIPLDQSQRVHERMVAFEKQMRRNFEERSRKK